MESTATSDRPAAAPAGAKRPRRYQAIVGLALLSLLIAAGWLAAPTLLWAYDIERAGSLLDAGLAWPTPRRFDSLPEARNAQALMRALPYLAAAAARRPTHPHAYRLAGQAYAALGDWDNAAAAYEQARTLAPDNPLIRYEASLIYARMHQISRTAPRTPLIDQLAAGRLDAPGTLIKSLFCSARGAESCYTGRASFRQGFAADPGAPELEAPAIFLHPPASLSASLTVPKTQPALHFIVGLDPAAREWASDGATFRVWVAAAGGGRELAAELAVDRATALRGWVPGWADLTRWAGQPVVLTIESGPGPAGDATDDWYVWAEPAFTSVAAARYATTLPGARARELHQGIR